MRNKLEMDSSTARLGDADVLQAGNSVIPAATADEEPSMSQEDTGEFGFGFDLAFFAEEPEAGRGSAASASSNSARTPGTPGLLPLPPLPAPETPGLLPLPQLPPLPAPETPLGGSSAAGAPPSPAGLS